MMVVGMITQIFWVYGTLVDNPGMPLHHKPA